MHALTGRRLASVRAQASAPGSQARVLPKWLRRPARIGSRIVNGDLKIPRYFEAALLGGFIGFCGLYGAAVGGQLSVGSERLAVAVGLGVTQIEVKGNTHTRVDDVYRALEIDGSRSLLTLNAVAARGVIEGLPWVEQAQLQKIYPGTLSVTLRERIPYALWQMGDAVTVVERDGSPIGPFAADPRIAALPLVVGTGAATNANALFSFLEETPWLLGQVHAAIRVGDRRWDLRLRNGMTIRMPENELNEAIARLELLDATYGVLGRDLAAIDLRLDDRTIFALTQNAAADRASFVEERAKQVELIKKRGSI
ncbi:MAG: cell division protein FtsQ/DivIB [Pseudomonadota bacterium]